jgi:hypothetical protein
MRERSSHNRRRTRRRPPEFCTPSGFAPSAWRGAALDRPKSPQDISLGARIGHKPRKTSGSRERLNAWFVSWCAN